MMTKPRGWRGHLPKPSGFAFAWYLVGLLEVLLPCLGGREGLRLGLRLDYFSVDLVRLRAIATVLDEVSVFLGLTTKKAIKKKTTNLQRFTV